MGIETSIISAVLKAIVGDKVEGGLVKELIDISIGEVSEKGIDKINDFINGGKNKIERILSEESMKSMNIPDRNIEYVSSEIKDLLLRINITDRVLKQCRYDSMNLSDFLWNEYCKNQDDYIECESNIKQCLFAVAKVLIELVHESEDFEKKFLIQISNSTDDIKSQIQINSQNMMKRFDRLEESNRVIIDEASKNTSVQNKNIEHKKPKSRTKEYADKWYDNMFLNNFDEWDENAKEEVKLKDVYIEAHLPHFKWGENEKESDQLKKLLSEYIGGHKKNQMLLILGQPGIGKSTLITWITANFTKNNILVYKCAPDLKDIEWESREIFNLILEKIGLEYNDLNGKTLILDGFDEINISYNREAVLERIYSYLIYGNLISGCSLIITCRENYVRFGRLKCKYITLQPWDEGQIRSFCAIFHGKTKKEISASTIDNIIKNKDVFGIPLILYMVSALNISIEEESSITHVYDKIFSLEGGIYDRCIENKNFDSSHRISEIKKQIHQISRKIAMWMFENNPEEACIPQKEYQNICAEIMQDVKKEKQDLEQDFLIGNYFKLVNHCEGIEDEQLYFVHRSIYEYFVAEYIFSSIYDAFNKPKEDLAGVCGEFLKGNKLSKHMLKFLQYKIKNFRLNEEFDKINETFQIMLCDGMTFHTKKCFKNVIDCEINVLNNMIKIVRLWGNGYYKPNNSITKYLKYSHEYNINLSGADLREINLETKNLSKMRLCRVNLSGKNMMEFDLSRTLLEGAYLQSSDLRSANLQEANLQGAKLQGTKLQEANLSLTCLKGAVFDEKQVAYLKQKYSLKDVKVYIEETKETISYEEYCNRKK